MYLNLGKVHHHLIVRLRGWRMPRAAESLPKHFRWVRRVIPLHRSALTILNFQMEANGRSKLVKYIGHRCAATQHYSLARRSGAAHHCELVINSRHISRGSFGHSQHADEGVHYHYRCYYPPRSTFIRITFAVCQILFHDAKGNQRTRRSISSKRASLCIPMLA